MWENSIFNVFFLLAMRMRILILFMGGTTSAWTWDVMSIDGITCISLDRPWKAQPVAILNGVAEDIACHDRPSKISMASIIRNITKWVF